MKYVPFVWCQIDSGAKLTLLHSWCQIGPVPNWLRCQIDSFHTLGAKLGPVPNWLFYTLGAKLTPQHSWCQIGSGAKLGPVPNCPLTAWWLGFLVISPFSWFLISFIISHHWHNFIICHHHKGYKFISIRKQEKYAKANCMTTKAHFLETMKKKEKKIWF